MPKNKIIISLGVIVLLMPFLGFPTSWESSLQVVCGLAIIGISLWSNIDKKLTMRAKAQRRHAQRRTQDRVAGLEPDAELGEESNVEDVANDDQTA